jgi:hypothetical protein
MAGPPSYAGGVAHVRESTPRTGRNTKREDAQAKLKAERAVGGTGNCAYLYSRTGSFVYKLSVCFGESIAESKSQLKRALDLPLGRHGTQALQPYEGCILGRLYGRRN